MSSGRRTGSDQSILEMLDRDTGRGSRRGGRSRLRWYGAGGALAIGLIGLLAWLSHDGPPPQEAEPIAVAEVVPPPDKAARPDPAAELSGLTDQDEPPRQHHAAVVDEQRGKEAKPITPVAMLAPAARPSPAPGGAVVQDEATLPPRIDTRATAPTTAPNRSGPIDGKRMASTHASRPAAPVLKKQAAIPGIDAPRKQPPRLANDTTRSRTQGKPSAAIARSPARKPAQNTPRAHKPAASAQPSHPAVDSDVALISAVIQHSSRGDNECADLTCAPKTTAQP